MTKKYSAVEKWILFSVPIIFIIGSAFHFLYGFSGQNTVVALVAPVNESVWEHIKLALIPTILFYFIFYLIARKSPDLNKNKWFTASLVSAMVSAAAIPLLFYFYTEAFGVEYLWADILIFFISVFWGQVLALHFYRRSNGINAYAAIILLILILAVFATLTFFAPSYPIFMDSQTGTYGI